MTSSSFCTRTKLGAVVSIRPITADDAAATFEWVTSDWFMHEFAGSSVPTDASHETFFRKVLSDDSQRMFAIEIEGKHVGNAGLKYIDSSRCECWYYIGDETMRGRGIATACVSLLVKFARDELDIGSLYASVYDYNLGSIHVLEENGFKKDKERSPLFGDDAMLSYSRVLKNG